MKYELIEKLKAAAFPHSEYMIGGPLLSELIEACGAKFGTLTRVAVAEGQHLYWIAEVSRVFQERYAEGATPEEAVAKLWLELHETKKSV